MIAFPAMLVGPAEEAGMKVPPDADNFDINEYPHFGVYCNCQLGAALPRPTSHWHNAKVIAEIPEDQIKTVSIIDLLGLGFEAIFN